MVTKIIVTGCGTGVGKTVASAIITAAINGDYWKPVESGCKTDSDTKTVRKLLSKTACQVHKSAYSLQAPLSPHHAAFLEKIQIDPVAIVPPQTVRPLVIETAGGIFVPLNERLLAIDLYCQWNARWVVVSKNYLGSINHTLLTLEALKNRGADVRLIIFNGQKNEMTQQAICHFSGQLQTLQLKPTHNICEYTKKWKKQLLHHLL